MNIWCCRQLLTHYRQHLDGNSHITGGRVELHRLDEMLLVPEGKARLLQQKQDSVGKTIENTQQLIIIAIIK